VFAAPIDLVQCQKRRPLKFANLISLILRILEQSYSADECPTSISNR